MLLDVFHALKAVLDALLKSHIATAMFIRDLADALLVPYPEDLKRIQERLLREGITDPHRSKHWTRVFLRGARRSSGSSPAHQLWRVDQVIQTYTDAIDPKTKEVLFRRVALEELENFRAKVAKGWLIDPEGIPMYREIGKNSRGEMVYQCTRGSSPLEGFHLHSRSLVQTHPQSPQLATQLNREFVYRWNRNQDIKYLGVDGSVRHCYDQSLMEHVNLLCLQLTGRPYFPGDVRSSSDYVFERNLTCGVERAHYKTPFDNEEYEGEEVEPLPYDDFDLDNNRDEQLQAVASLLSNRNGDDANHIALTVSSRTEWLCKREAQGQPVKDFPVKDEHSPQYIAEKNIYDEAIKLVERGRFKKLNFDAVARKFNDLVDDHVRKQNEDVNQGLMEKKDIVIVYKKVSKHIEDFYDCLKGNTNLGVFWEDKGAAIWTLRNGIRLESLGVKREPLTEERAQLKLPDNSMEVENIHSHMVPAVPAHLYLAPVTSRSGHLIQQNGVAPISASVALGPLHIPSEKEIFSKTSQDDQLLDSAKAAFISNGKKKPDTCGVCGHLKWIGKYRFFHDKDDAATCNVHYSKWALDEETEYCGRCDCMHCAIIVRALLNRAKDVSLSVQWERRRAKRLQVAKQNAETLRQKWIEWEDCHSTCNPPCSWENGFMKIAPASTGAAENGTPASTEASENGEVARFIRFRLANSQSLAILHCQPSTQPATTSSSSGVTIKEEPLPSSSFMELQREESSFSSPLALLLASKSIHLILSDNEDELPSASTNSFTWTKYSYVQEPQRRQTLQYSAEQRRILINQRSQSSPTTQEREQAQRYLCKWDNDITPAQRDELVRPVQFSIDMTQGKFRRLRGREYALEDKELYLCDESINFVIEMLAVQNDALCTANPTLRRCHFFPSHFVTRILEDGFNYDKVKRWAKKKDIFEADKIFFPIHLSWLHWALGVVDMQQKDISYYCSLHREGGAKDYCRHLMEWVKWEYFNRSRGKPFPYEDFTFTIRKGPLQGNPYDCGPFVLKVIDYLTNNLPLTFTQADISRIKLATDIIRGHFNYSNDPSKTV